MEGVVTMSIKSGITQGTPAKIKFGAGVFFTGVEYSENVAPTEADIKSKVFGATTEGGKITITPEFYSPDVDGVTVAMKELKLKVSETATMETAIIEYPAERVAKAIIGEINNSTDSDYDVITSSELRSGHFYDGFGYYGELLDGRPFIVLFKHALCTSGFALETKNKEASKFSGTYECMSDIEYGVDKLPYALFIRKEKGWTATTKEEITGNSD